MPVGVYGSAKEKLTGGVRTISTDHSSIHKQEGFSFSYPYGQAATLAPNSSVSIQVKVPTLSYGEVHWKVVKVTTNSVDMSVSFIEDPTLIDGVTPIPSHNRSRKPLKTLDIPQAATQIYLNPTGVSSGTILETLHILGSLESQQGTPRVSSVGIKLT